MSVKEKWEQELETGRDQQMQVEGEKEEMGREREEDEKGESNDEGEKEILGKERESEVSTTVRRSNKVRRGVDRLDL